MTATQAPTPGPLSGDDVKPGDLLRHERGLVIVRMVEPDVGLHVGYAWTDGVQLVDIFENFAFIGRPDADGWMPWSGGENPVPGQAIDTKFRDGYQVDGQFADRWDWVHGSAERKNADGADDIIAFRLAPTAPVEASGSVGLAASEVGAHIAKRDAEYEAALADLTIKPDASSLEEFGRSIFGALSDCPAMSIDKQADFVARALWPVVSTTPARAEAQDEGAAAIASRLVDNIACATQNRALLVGDPAEDKVLTEAIRENALQEIERLLNRAHPSPTPAADADRVRIAVEALEPFAVAADRLEQTGRWHGFETNWNDVLELVNVHELRVARSTLAALKSTAAKEGGE